MSDYVEDESLDGFSDRESLDHLDGSVMMDHTSQADLRSVHDRNADFSQSQSIIQSNQGALTLYDDASVNSETRRINAKNGVIQQYDAGRRLIQDQYQRQRMVTNSFLEFIQNSPTIQKQLRRLYSEALHQKSLKHILVPDHLRLIVDVLELDTIPSTLIKDQPMVALPAFESAIREFWKLTVEQEGGERTLEVLPPRVGFLGWMGANHITPRGLNSSILDKLTCIEGVVNKCSATNPKLVETVYVGESTDPNFTQPRSVHIRPHYDITDFDKTARDAGKPPMQDPEKKVAYRLEAGMCQYRNHQKFVLQETPETAPTGQMPRWVDVIVEDDLCDTVKCGDRVRVWGVYRLAGGGRANPEYSGTGRPYLVAVNIQIKNREKEELTEALTSSDIAAFHSFAERDDMLEILSHSFAPSICGYDIVKCGLLLMLVGGEEKASSDGMHVRGDIHVLLVGDPSCGKSQLLRYVLGIRPGSISASGRGSSGVGLTAAVVTDQDTGERRVEGGAMVLADRKVICIDEFDKMHVGDRVAIHEVMEQQTVTVAKAGIHTTLNARCSVLAAANPIYGCWSDDQEYRHQLNFEDALLSRFDMIFVIRDSATEADDERISEAVLRNLTERAMPVLTETRRKACDNVVQSDSSMYGNSEDNADKGDTSVFADRHVLSYYDRDGCDHQVLSPLFLKKYISYARHTFYQDMANTRGWSSYPEISEEAAAAIVEFFAEIRQRELVSRKQMIQSITARTLEAIIRISTAHAKLKLQKWVVKRDVDFAKQILLYTIFGEKFVATPEEFVDSDSDSVVAEEYDENRQNLQNSAVSRQASKEGRSKKSFLHRRGKRNKNSDTIDTSVGNLGIEIENMSINQHFKKRKHDAFESDEQLASDEILNSKGRTENSASVLSPKDHNILLQLVNDILTKPANENGISFRKILETLSQSHSWNRMDPDSFCKWLQSVNDGESAPLLYSSGMVYPC